MDSLAKFYNNVCILETHTHTMSNRLKTQLEYLLQLWNAPLHLAGSVFRDEFDLAILQLQENNRLEILKRKWWEGGQCPKEEDHRAKGKTLLSPTPLLSPCPQMSANEDVQPRSCNWWK